MAVLMFVAPVLPGQTEANRQFGKELVSTRQKEHVASRKRLGWTSEQVWHQVNPDGSVIIIPRLGMDDPEKTLKALAASTDPFDVYFKKKVLEQNGLDFNKPLSGPRPEKIFDLRSPPAGRVTHLASAFPILPGKTQKTREVAKTLSGPKRQEYQAASQAAGLVTEEWWINQTPKGDFVIAYWEAPNPVDAILHSVKHPTEVDRWLFQAMKETTGIDFSDLKNVPTKWPETIIDWKA